MLDTIQQITSHYLMRSNLSLSLGSDEAIYVEYGFARFVDAETKSVAVDEPLVLLAATHYLNTSHTTNSSYKHFAKQIHQHDPSSNGFENYLAFCLDMAFSIAQRQISEVFSFVGGPPHWAQQRARLVALERVRSGEMEWGLSKHYAFSGSSVTLGVNAKSPHETMNWLDGLKHSPICFPDINMGPDLLFVLRLEDDTQLWVALQAKYAKGKGGKGTLPRDSLRKAMKSVTPSKFFLNKVRRSLSLTTPTILTGWCVGWDKALSIVSPRSLRGHDQKAEGTSQPKDRLWIVQPPTRRRLLSCRHQAQALLR